MRPFLAFLLLAPSAALARCPTADDISNGIVYANTLKGSESINVAYGTTAYLASYYELGDYGLTKTFLMLKGVYPLSLTAITSDPLLTVSYHYAVPQSAFPEPAPGVNWQVEAVLARGDDTVKEVQTYTFGAEEERSIGGCDVLVLPYDIATESEMFGTQTLEMLYFPVLGLAFPDVRRGLAEGDLPDFTEKMTTYPDLLAEWGN